MSNRVKVWCHQFQKILHHIGFDTSNLMSEGSTRITLKSVRCEDVLSTFDSWFLSKWSNLPPDPRSAPQQQVLYAVYDQWFAPARMRDLEGEARFDTSPLYIQHTAGIKAAHLLSMLRFRLGAHDLPVATGRWTVDPSTRQRVPRQQRYCEECSSSSIGDEFHMIFECQFYNSVRSRFAQLFTKFGGLDNLQQLGTATGQHMAKFMSQDKRQVAAFVHLCWLLRCNPRCPFTYFV